MSIREHGKPSEILRAAAAQCINRPGSFQWALTDNLSLLHREHETIMDYWRLMLPDDDFWCISFTPETKALALCFAADIAESEGN